MHFIIIWFYFSVKVCDKKHIIKEKKQTYIRREREALHLLNNTLGFVNLYCTFQDETKLYFVMTYAKNGELLPYINKVGSFDLTCSKFYAAELLLSIEEMHKRNIIHRYINFRISLIFISLNSLIYRDLKPENILLNHEMHLMIADFGSSRILPKDFDYEKLLSDFEKQQKEESEKKKSHDEFEMRSTRKNSELGERKNSFVGTAQYVAPEILKGGLPHWSTDLWALGCIIYQMISGLPPYRGPNDYLIFQQVLNCQYEFPEGFDHDAKDLVKKLLQLDPRQRLGSTDLKECRYNSIRNHKFFDGIVWDEIRKQKPPQISPYLPGNGQEEELRGEYTCKFSQFNH
jgi:3-phosphoinositide dependent protein kinase-1